MSPQENDRILVIRGGAIGDFILTLPALKALRDAHPRAHIEILGHKHIAVLAEYRFYAQSVRSIEQAPLSSFFVANSELSATLAGYFASFDLVISYVYDPDRTFQMNLQRCGVSNFIGGPHKISGATHAARQLARPIEKLGIHVQDFAAKVYPSNEDRRFAAALLCDCPRPITALHPASGSERKNWPLENWITIGNELLDSQTFDGSIIVVSGEADKDRCRQLKRTWNNRCVRFVSDLPLPCLAAVLENTIFLGHDSGISHLAAASGANCILLFGPTDPSVWAPLNERVRILRAPFGDLQQLDPDLVWRMLATLTNGAFQSGTGAIRGIEVF